MVRHFQKITFNLTGNNKRYESLDGKQYLVVPAVVLTEGVHTGSAGPLLYTRDEMSKNTAGMNHRPAVINHPMMNGEGITATDPAVLEKQGIGKTMRAEFDGRSKMEVWIDENKLMRVNRGVYDRIHNNQMVEVSTGLYHDLDPTPGEWNGQHYDGIVRNMVLDHLAILPDEIGACSIAKGAGLLRNATHELSHNDVKDHLHAEHNKTANDYDSPLSYKDRAYIHDVFPKHVVYEKGGKHFKHEYKVKNGKASFHGEPEEVHKQTSYITANGEALVNTDESGPLSVIKKPKISEMSEEMRRQQFQKTLSEKLAGAEQAGEWGGWTQEVLANHVVWSKDGKLFRLPYTYDNDKIKLGTDTEEVERVEGKVSEYRRKQPLPGTDGTQSPPSINFSLERKQPMSQPTPEQVQAGANKSYAFLTKTLKVPDAQARQMVQNAIHAGAHQLIHDATQHMDAHQEPNRSDGQARSTVGGARKDAVDHMVKGGSWKEEDRQFLMDLPDDHFQRVQKNTIAGATQQVVPYSYEGIGDRSNAHTANAAQPQHPTLDSWLNAQPPEVRSLVSKALKTYGKQKLQLVNFITNAQGNAFTKEELLAMEPDTLERLARLAGAGRPTQSSESFNLEAAVLGNAQPNYTGQGAAFDLTTQPTQNQAQNQADILTLPNQSWADSASA